MKPFNKPKLNRANNAVYTHTLSSVWAKEKA